MRSELRGVAPCRPWDPEEPHSWWCHALGECQPRPALIAEQHELAWNGAPQWRRGVNVVRVSGDVL